MRNPQQNALLANILINPSTGLPYRGQRNNNLLNIRYNKANNWQGQTGQDDSGYAQFDDRFSGIRAADRVLNNYGKLHNIDTIEGMVNRFAPKDDNNPVDAYVDNIYSKTGIERGSKINLQDPNVRNQLLPVMGNFETPGANITLDDLQRARAFGKEQTTPSNNQGAIANPLFDPSNDVNVVDKPDIDTSYNTGFMPGNATSTRKRQGQMAFDILTNRKNRQANQRTEPIVANTRPGFLDLKSRSTLTPEDVNPGEDLLGQKVSRTALQIMSANPDEVITSKVGDVTYQHLKDTSEDVKKVLAKQAIQKARDAISFAPFTDEDVKILSDSAGAGDGAGAGAGSGTSSGTGTESGSFLNAGMYRSPATQINTNVEKPETERDRLTRLIQEEYKPTSMNKNKYLLGILGGIMADRFGDPTVNNNNFGQFMDYAQNQNANNYEQYNDRRNALLEQLKLLDDQSIDKQDSAGYYNPYGTGIMYGYYDGNKFVRVRDSLNQRAEYSAAANAGGMTTPVFAPPAVTVVPDATNNLPTEAGVVSVDPETQKNNAQYINNIASNYEFVDELSDKDKERKKTENINNLESPAPTNAFVIQDDGSKKYWFNTDQPGQLETIRLPGGKTIDINSRALKKYQDTYGSDAPQVIASLLKQTDGLARELNTLDNILATDPKILNKMTGPFRGEGDNKLGKTLVGTSKALDYFLPEVVGGKRGVAQDINTAISFFDQFDGQVYAKAYEILKGAGQITEFEAQTVAKGLTNINRGLSGENLVEAIKEYKLINQIILDNGKARFGMRDENGNPYVEKDLKKALAELKGRN